jgi:hypothetical protein
MASLTNITAQALPTVDFLVTARGITVISDRLDSGKFIPFDLMGKCSSCKADTFEIDYAVGMDGVFLFSPRLKTGKFVSFDYKFELPNHCLFRVSCKGRVFNIPHNMEPAEKTEGVDVETQTGGEEDEAPLLVNGDPDLPPRSQSRRKPVDPRQRKRKMPGLFSEIYPDMPTTSAQVKKVKEEEPDSDSPQSAPPSPTKEWEGVWKGDKDHIKQ